MTVILFVERESIDVLADRSHRIVKPQALRTTRRRPSQVPFDRGLWNRHDGKESSRSGPLGADRLPWWQDGIAIESVFD
ncbi:MAG: hypothetical protein ACR2OO_17740 [Thermomicrobiales bacterium]